MIEFYVSMRVKNLKDPDHPIIPALRGKCMKCKEEVIYSKRVYDSDPHMKEIIDAGRLICTDCATTSMKDDDEVKIVNAVFGEVDEMMSNMFKEAMVIQQKQEERNAAKALVEWIAKFHVSGKGTLSTNQIVGLLEATKHFMISAIEKDYDMKEWREEHR